MRLRAACERRTFVAGGGQCVACSRHMDGRQVHGRANRARGGQGERHRSRASHTRLLPSANIKCTARRQPPLHTAPRSSRDPVPSALRCTPAAAIPAHAPAGDQRTTFTLAACWLRVYRNSTYALPTSPGLPTTPAPVTVARGAAPAPVPAPREPSSAAAGACTWCGSRTRQRRTVLSMPAVASSGSRGWKSSDKMGSFFAPSAAQTMRECNKWAAGHPLWWTP
jgi:hypothetical protein